MEIKMEEIWKPVKGYEDCYEVSNTGKIKSIKTNKEVSWIIYKKEVRLRMEYDLLAFRYSTS